MSAENQVFRLRSTLGIAFEKASLSEIGLITRALDGAGVPYEVNEHRTNNAIFIEIDPGLADDGVPISASFARSVAAIGGRFSGGTGLASLLNRIGRGPAVA